MRWIGYEKFFHRANLFFKKKKKKIKYLRSDAFLINLMSFTKNCITQILLHSTLNRTASGSNRISPTAEVL